MEIDLHKYRMPFEYGTGFVTNLVLLIYEDKKTEVTYDMFKNELVKIMEFDDNRLLDYYSKSNLLKIAALSNFQKALTDHTATRLAADIPKLMMLKKSDFKKMPIKSDEDFNDIGNLLRALRPYIANNHIQNAIDFLCKEELSTFSSNISTQNNLVPMPHSTKLLVLNEIGVIDKVVEILNFDNFNNNKASIGKVICELLEINYQNHKKGFGNHNNYTKNGKEAALRFFEKHKINIKRLKNPSIFEDLEN